MCLRVFSTLTEDPGDFLSPNERPRHWGRCRQRCRPGWNTAQLQSSINTWQKICKVLVKYGRSCSTRKLISPKSAVSNWRWPVRLEMPSKFIFTLDGIFCISWHFHTRIITYEKANGERFLCIRVPFCFDLWPWKPNQSILWAKRTLMPEQNWFLSHVSKRIYSKKS